MATTDNPGGLLTQVEEEYTECFTFKQEGFTELLDLDEAHWKESVAIV